LPTQAPIACTLGPADFEERLEGARALGADALVGLEVAGRSALLRFDGARERVEELAAAEARCCSFLDLDVTPAGRPVELAIRAPEGAEPMMRSLVAAVVAGWEGGL
jgi:hypothetical protein